MFFKRQNQEYTLKYDSNGPIFYYCILSVNNVVRNNGLLFKKCLPTIL